MKSVEDSAKEMLEMEMPFRLNAETFVIESGDSRIYMTGGGNAGPERGKQFVLHVGEKAFGFRTADDITNHKVELLAGGTRLWWFDDLLCELRGTEPKNRGTERTRYGVLTNAYRFESLDEQGLILELFIKAMEAFDTRVLAGVTKRPNTIARLTPRAAELVAAGKFLA
jgi:hypothetical protein